MKTIGITAVIQYILTAVESFDSQDYYNKSLMMIFGLAGVLFCENEQTEKNETFNTYQMKKPDLYYFETIKMTS